MNDVEATRPFASAPWDVRLDTVVDADDGVQAAAQAQETQGIRVATCVSARNQLVGIGGTIEGINWVNNDNEQCEYNRTTIGTSTQTDAYTAALASIKVGLGMVVNAVYAGALSPRAHGRTIHLFTNNRTALATLKTPVRRSRQATVSKILRHVRYLTGFRNRVVFAWTPVNSVFELGQKAKRLAQRSTEEGRAAQDPVELTKRAVQNVQERLRRAPSQTSTMFGETVRRIDAAWPGNHTRRIYDDLSKRRASVLAQLRTSMTPLNGYLHNIKATETNLCDCGEAAESREHFIFYCARWSEQRRILGIWTSGHNLSPLLGGKSTTDTDDWKPDMEAVRAVINFTLANKRFDHDNHQRWRTTK